VLLFFLIIWEKFKFNNLRLLKGSSNVFQWTIFQTKIWHSFKRKKNFFFIIISGVWFVLFSSQQNKKKFLRIKIKLLGPIIFSKRMKIVGWTSKKFTVNLSSSLFVCKKLQLLGSFLLFEVLWKNTAVNFTALLCQSRYRKLSFLKIE